MVECFCINHRVGIGHHTQLRIDEADAVIECCRLAATLWAEDNLYVRIALQAQVGIVGGTVGDPHDVQTLLRIVELKGVLHLLLYDVLFVVGTNEEGDIGQCVIVRKTGDITFAVKGMLDFNEQP